MENSALSVDFAFLCDDVRQEGNGKYIFIGAYNEAIILQGNENEFELDLKMVTKLRNTGEDKYQFELEALFDGEKKMDLEGEISSGKSGASFIPFPVLIKGIKVSGELTINFREKGLEWESVMKIPVQISTDS